MFWDKKNTNSVVDAIDFSSLHVSTGQVGEYILNLYKEEGFRHIGYRAEGNRFIIYTLSGNDRVIQYFKDRCPAMIEDACKKLKGRIHVLSKWPNSDLSEVSIK